MGEQGCLQVSVVVVANHHSTYSVQDSTTKQYVEPRLWLSELRTPVTHMQAVINRPKQTTLE